MVYDADEAYLIGHDDRLARDESIDGGGASAEEAATGDPAWYTRQLGPGPEAGEAAGVGQLVSWAPRVRFPASAEAAAGPDDNVAAGLEQHRGVPPAQELPQARRHQPHRLARTIRDDKGASAPRGDGAVRAALGPAPGYAAVTGWVDRGTGTRQSCHRVA